MLRDSLGELRVLGEGEEPEIIETFRLDATDGERWKTVLDTIEWLFEEADGGAIGRYRKAPNAVVYVDNEGQWTLSPTLIDHLRSKDWDDEHKATIESFAKEHGLPAPLTKAARKAAVKGVDAPDALVKKLAKSQAKKDSEATAPKAAAKKGARQAPPTTERGPRPLCRMITVTRAPDDAIYTLSPEDFGGAYGEKITRGATFRFDATRASFVRLAAMTASPYSDEAKPWRGFRFAPESCVEGDAWREKPTFELPIELYNDFTATRLKDKSWFVVTPVGKSAFRYADHKIERVATLPHARSNERAIELADGRVLLAQGQVNYQTVLQTTIVDLQKQSAIDGPDLPGEYGTLFASKGRAVLLHGYPTSSEQPATLSIFDGTRWTHHAAPAALYDEKGSMDLHPLCELSDGRLLLHRWSSLELALLDVDARTVEPAGALHVCRGGQGVELPDGRVLIVGGTLFKNIDAEPELWDPVSKQSSALPGYDKELAKQRAALEKELAKAKKH